MLVWVWTINDDDSVIMSGVATTAELAKREMWHEWCELGNANAECDEPEWKNFDTRISGEIDIFVFIARQVALVQS